MIRLGPFFKYYGSKHQIAARYPRPKHNRVIEPFAGSAQYATLHHTRDVVLVDSWLPVVECWRYLINATKEDILALPLLEPEQRVEELELEPVQRWLVRCWLGTISVRPCRKLSGWALSDIARGWSTYWGKRCRLRLANQVHHINHWTVLHGSYTDIEESSPSTWFIDPPYQDKGYKYVHGSELLDYDALGVWSRTRNGQVIVCENEGAGWLPFRPLCSAQSGVHRIQPKKEAIWTKDCWRQGELF